MDEVLESDEAEEVGSEEKGVLSVGSVSEESDGSDGLVSSELTLSDEVSSLEELATELGFEEDTEDEASLALDAADELLSEEVVLEEELLEADELEAVLLEVEFLFAYQSFFSIPFNSI